MELGKYLKIDDSGVPHKKHDTRQKFDVSDQFFENEFQKFSKNSKIYEYTLYAAGGGSIMRKDPVDTDNDRTYYSFYL